MGGINPYLAAKALVATKSKYGRGEHEVKPGVMELEKKEEGEGEEEEEEVRCYVCDASTGREGRVEGGVVGEVLGEEVGEAPLLCRACSALVELWERARGEVARVEQEVPSL